MKARSKQTIGLTDKIDFVEFGMENIDCKIDTGANTSALHCHKVQLIETEEKPFVQFYLLDPAHPAYCQQAFRAYDFKERKVKSSFGNAQNRFSIKTKIQFMGRTFKTEFTLSDRGKMRFPILLGKRFLKGRFLVDVTLHHVSFHSKISKEVLSK